MNKFRIVEVSHPHRLTVYNLQMLKKRLFKDEWIHCYIMRGALRFPYSSYDYISLDQLEKDIEWYKMSQKPEKKKIIREFEMW